MRSRCASGFHRLFVPVVGVVDTPGAVPQTCQNPDCGGPSRPSLCCGVRPLTSQVWSGHAQSQHWCGDIWQYFRPVSNRIYCSGGCGTLVILLDACNTGIAVISLASSANSTVPWLIPGCSLRTGTLLTRRMTRPSVPNEGTSWCDSRKMRN